MARKQSTGTIAAGGTLTQDVVLGGSQFLTVIGIIGPTATGAADVSVQVFPFLDDPNGAGVEQTVTDLPLPTVDSVAAVLANNKAQILARYRVSGIRRVRIALKNNNVGALAGEIDFGIS